MRIGKVIGRITLSKWWPTLTGGRFLLVEVQDRYSLTGQPRKTSETLVAYDNLGAVEGDMIAFSESREACNPFYPEKIVPLDAYNACVLDVIEVDRQVAMQLDQVKS